MNDITLNLIVLAAVALLGGLIFLIVRRNQARNEQEIVQMAVERGWKYEPLREPLAWGLRLTSPRWMLEAISRSSGKETGPGSSDVSMQTTWHAAAPGSTLLIGERQSQVVLGAVGDILVRQVLQLALGADAEGLEEIQVGSGAFQQRFMVWAQDPDDVQIPSALQSILLNWRGQKPLIKRTSKGLTIELRGVHLRKPADLSALVQLGEIFI